MHLTKTEIELLNTLAHNALVEGVNFFNSKEGVSSYCGKVEFIVRLFTEAVHSTRPDLAKITMLDVYEVEIGTELAVEVIIVDRLGEIRIN